MFAVNVGTGELCVNASDGYLPGPIPIDLTRTYSSQNDRDVGLGPGWTYSALPNARLVDGTIVVSNGSTELFVFDPLQRSVLVETVGVQVWRLKPPSDQHAYVVAMRKGVAVVEAVEDDTGASVTFDYDAQGRLRTITDAAQRLLSFSYEGTHLEQIVLVAHGGEPVNLLLVAHRHDRLGFLVASTDSTGATHQFSYVGRRLTEHKHPLGGTTCFAYDQRDRCIRQWETSSNFSRTYLFDDVRRRTLLVDSLGHRWLYCFDASGLLKEIVDPLGGITATIRDPKGNIMATCDANGQMTTFHFADERHRTYRRVDASGAATTIILDEAENVVAAIDPCGHTWTHIKGKDGRPTGMRTPSGHQWTFEQILDADTTITLVRNPAGALWRYRQSADCRTLTIDLPDESWIKAQFDSLGELSMLQKSGRASVKIARNRGREDVSSDNGSVAIDYNHAGMPIRIRKETGAVWVLHYDVYGRLVAQQDPTGDTTTFEYDSERRLQRVFNPNGDQFINEFDPLGRIVRQQQFDGRVDKYEYDAGGRLMSRTDPCGLTVDLISDAVGRPIRRTYSTGEIYLDSYDEMGRLTVADHPTGVLQLEYDPDGRLSREVFEGVSTEYQYGWSPFPVVIQTESRRVEFAYDPAGRLVSVRETPDIEIDLHYDSSPDRETIRFLNGPVLERDYDMHGRLAHQQVRSEDGALVLDESFAYASDGNLAQVDRLGSEARYFDYNVKGELARIRSSDSVLFNFEYDRAGNATPVQMGAATFGRGNRLTSLGDTRIDNDEAGRPVHFISPEGVTTLCYDPLGRLETINRPSGECVNFIYDGIFRRRVKTTPDGSRRTNWVGDTPFSENLPSGVEIRYVYHPITDTPLAIRIDQVWHCVVVDGRGEVTSLIRLSDGTIAWRSDSLGFLSVVVLNELRDDMALRGPGQMADSETGLVWQRARYYAPAFARFLTPDPLGLVSGLNAYTFCRNMPLSVVDPLGLDGCAPKEECDDILEEMNKVVDQKKENGVGVKGLRQRWNEMNNPKHGLPTYGASGSLESHVKEYRKGQEKLGACLKEYYSKKCQVHEDANRREEMRDLRKWQTKKVEFPSGFAVPTVRPASAGAGLSLADEVAVTPGQVSRCR